MDVHVVPSIGILIKKQLYNRDFKGEKFHLNSLKGLYNGNRMVYAPESTLVKQVEYYAESVSCNT